MQDHIENHVAISRVLVVDDDEFMRDLLPEMLQRLGITTVRCAENGTQALAELQAKACWPEILVCDLAMPGMDGIEFLRHLATLDFDGGIVLFSGTDRRILSSAEQLGRAHGLNMLGTIEKPVSFATLRDTLNTFNPNRHKASPHTLIALTAAEIRDGVAAGCVTIYVQPKVDVLSRQVMGVECLARWADPQRGILPPSAFIDTAEQAGLIEGITHAVFRQAAQWAGEWRRRGHLLKVSVNISMNDLDRLDLPEQLSLWAKEGGIPNEWIMLELTESRLMGDQRVNLDIITRLRLKEFGLSIDDFGTGYSTLDKLKNLPFTELKIDRAFVHGASHDQAAYAILESSAHLARALGLSVVAEGAESPEDWAVIAQLGIDEVQGFIVARPMPASEFLPWLETWQKKSAINLTQLHDLVGGDPEVHHRVLKKFLQVARQNLDALAEADRLAQPEVIGALGHRLKTGARSIGAQALADACQALEEAGAAGNLLTCRELIHTITEQFTPVAQTIDAQLAQRLC